MSGSRGTAGSTRAWSVVIVVMAASAAAAEAGVVRWQRRWRAPTTAALAVSWWHLLNYHDVREVLVINVGQRRARVGQRGGRDDLHGSEGLSLARLSLSSLSERDRASLPALRLPHSNVTDVRGSPMARGRWRFR